MNARLATAVKAGVFMMGTILGRLFTRHKLKAADFFVPLCPFSPTRLPHVINLTG